MINKIYILLFVVCIFIFMGCNSEDKLLPKLDYYELQLANGNHASPQFGAQQLVDQARVGLALGGFHVQVGDDLGTHLAAGLPCRHLAFTQPDVDWQLWIEQGTAPLPRKLVITDKQKMGWPQYAVTFTGFDFQPSLPEKLFTFTPEKNARKIEFLPLARPQGQAK